MKFGFYLPTRGDTATTDGLVSMVQNAERLNFNSVMIADHIVFPTARVSFGWISPPGKPYSENFIANFLKRVSA